jgi:hypothetical protein
MKRREFIALLGGSDVAAHGARTAAGNASYWLSQLSVAWTGCAPSKRVSSRSE